MTSGAHHPKCWTTSALRGHCSGLFAVPHRRRQRDPAIHRWRATAPLYRPAEPVSRQVPPKVARESIHARKATKHSGNVRGATGPFKSIWGDDVAAQLWCKSSRPILQPTSCGREFGFLGSTPFIGLVWDGENPALEDSPKPPTDVWFGRVVERGGGCRAQVD